MRVLITGVSGLVGRTTAARLVGAGHDVVGLSRSAPLELPRQVTHVRGDIGDDAVLSEALDGVDAVIHCAFMLDAREGLEQMERTNVGGTRKLIAAAEKAGVRRAIFLSSVTVYGPRSGPHEPARTEASGATPHPDQPYAVHKAECERLFEQSSLSSVLVRAAIILGRGTDNRLQENLAGGHHIGAKGPEYPWQVIHHDDVAAFLAEAITSEREGVVNLAADGPVSQRRIAEVLDRTLLELPRGAMINAAKIAGGMLHITAGEVAAALRMPMGDLTELHEKWGFTAVWDGPETVLDTRLAVVGRTTRKGRVVAASGRIPYLHQIVAADAPAADGAPLDYSGPADLRGEFDTPIDRRFPVYSQTNLAEALPGPSTALTLDVQGRALRGTTSAVAELLGLPGALRTEASARLQAVHAHRMYINASATYHVSLVMPGTNPEELATQFTGTHADELPGGQSAIEGTYRSPTQSAVTKAKTAAAVGVRVVSLVRSAERDVAEVRSQTARLEAFLDELDTMSDAKLRQVLLLGGDLLAYAWTVQGVVNLVSGAALTIASKKSDDNLDLGDDLESGATLRGVRELARAAAADADIVAILGDRSPGLPERVEQRAPDFWRKVQIALDRFGHRGPAESEFAARSFSDDVHSFLVTVGRAASGVDAAPAHSATARELSMPQKIAAKLLTQREQNRDRCVRLTWIMRRLVREQGRRLVGQGRIDAPDDLFHLTLGVLVDPPEGVREIIATRKAERERLAQLHMPPIFAEKWEAAEVLKPLEAGEKLDGIGICGGKVVGRARLVEPDTIDDVEPGEIMIAHVTDIGYTALFGHVAAVVTDIGGVMSHAAVVAREFGVACVVDTQVAATRIPDGALVEVDGTAGTITVLEVGPADQTLVSHPG
ncbi:NAD-dependent epimerase/dehydratase family protein [Gordonia sp. zg691]|uniref:NAD-dependent epimerase/dehydratase family protein n=1 Tax=Gordonia jinghuaiqii TaxID=2758710 RepID=UPI00166257BB|nr:NAD-dependent epimerase/dehydratase family protein [Gordonia jinghuaiqii]MBD0862494.1 NAD-dependent epimerase/dehydratase family protein [Gordonia jinghuaiqii]